MARSADYDQWERRPAREDMPLTFLVNRAGPGGHQPQIILSHDFDGGYVHFVRGRSIKCPKGPCDHCLAHKERRWRGYAVCANARTSAITLVEVTAAAMGPIDIYFRKHRTLRGAMLETIRIPKAVNGRLYSTISEGAHSLNQYPDVPSVRSILRKLWGLRKLEDMNGELDRRQREKDDNPDPQES